MENGNVNEKKTIMLVDDNMTNLTVGKEILKDVYKTYPVPSAEIMFELLENLHPDMILLDVEMPGMDGFAAIKKLKADERWADIPVIFLTAKIGENNELEGLSLGAIDYIFKPFSAHLLLRRIENHMLLIDQNHQLKSLNNGLEDAVRQKTRQIFELQDAILSTVADLVEFRDGVTGGHVSRTQRYLELLIKEVIDEKLYSDITSQWDVVYLVQSAQLHDVGKIAISDLILSKPGKLTDEEFEIMKTHTTEGVKVIQRIERYTEEHSFLEYAKQIAGTHHEKWDGSGYPHGLSGENIPLEGRLMAIADVYDALVSVRPYKKAMTTEEAEKIIIEGRGKHFDPYLVDIFAKIADRFAAIQE